MSNIRELSSILMILKNMFPNAGCELNYRNVYELTVSVILSAQTTDKAVNKITPELFLNYPDIYALSEADINDLQKIIKPLGLYKNKSLNLIQMAVDVVKNYQGSIPSNFEELMKLKGIGRKTANVILVEYFHIPRFPVDTHIERVSKRLDLVDESDNVIIVETKLSKSINPIDYHLAHHLLLFFGRYHCLSKNPKCSSCLLKKYCKQYDKKP